MRRRGFSLAPAIVLVCVVALISADAAAALTRVRVTPAGGHQTTRFVVRFRNPVQTGTFGRLRRQERLSAAGPAARPGCVSSWSSALGTVRRGAPIRVTLNPKRRRMVWCAGRFQGRIVETQTVICQRVNACPSIAIRPRTVARFSFRVSRGGTKVAPQIRGPQFAGLQSATTCVGLTPGALPRARDYQLRWSAASDPVTPGSAIVYDVYFASTPGGENFSAPAQTSAAGATSASVAVASLAPAYFVVRARDGAGLEDQNTVEREGVNQCG